MPKLTRRKLTSHSHVDSWHLILSQMVALEQLWVLRLRHFLSGQFASLGRIFKWLASILSKHIPMMSLSPERNKAGSVLFG